MFKLWNFLARKEEENQLFGLMSAFVFGCLMAVVGCGYLFYQTGRPIAYHDPDFGGRVWKVVVMNKLDGEPRQLEGWMATNYYNSHADESWVHRKSIQPFESPPTKAAKAE